jgi:predicted amidohydrolase
VKALCVAAAQTVSIRGEIESNVAHHCALAELAAEKGADAVVFPELSLTGYELDVAFALAFSADDPRLGPLIETSNASESTLIVGAPIRLDSGLHIGAFVLEPGARPRIYTKRFPFGAENDVFAPGSLDQLIELGDDRAALAICADTSHAEHAEAAAKRKASLYLAGVCFDADWYPAGTGLLSGYAAKHAMAVVMANAGAPATNFGTAGGSAVWSETGAPVVRLEGLGAGVAVARRDERGWSGETVRL